MAKQADTNEFTDELATNPLGDQVDLKAIGPFIVELYDNPIGTHRRRREGEPLQGVINVWEKADPDHWRGYETLATAWFEEERATAEYTGLQSEEGVRAFVEEHAE